MVILSPTTFLSMNPNSSLNYVTLALRVQRKSVRSHLTSWAASTARLKLVSSWVVEEQQLEMISCTAVYIYMFIETAVIVNRSKGCRYSWFQNVTSNCSYV